MDRIIGSWIKENNRPASRLFVCSVCSSRVQDKAVGSPVHGVDPNKPCTYKFCPYCGSEMMRKMKDWM